MSLYDKVFPPKKMTISNGKTIEKPASRLPLVAVILLIMTAISVKITGFDLRVLAERGNQFFVILGMMIPPRVSYMSQIWKPLFDTIKMSLLGTVVGAVLVVPFAMAASTNVIKSRLVISEYCENASHAGNRSDRYLCIRTGHSGRNHGDCHLHICLYGENPV